MGEPGGVGTGAVPAENLLVYQGEVFINFRTSRQWVLIKLFALPADADDHEVLALLIRHIRYRDSYAAPEFKDAKTIHGPYWLNAISPEAFSPVSAADAEAIRLRGQADAEADRIRNEAASKDPQFYAFLRKLEEYQRILGDNKTMFLLSTHREMFDTLFQPPMSSKSEGRQ